MSDLLLRPTAVSFEGTSALIRNLGRSCTPEQYLREFLKNSIEACERSNAKGQKIIVDFNETILNTTGHYKVIFCG